MSGCEDDVVSVRMDVCACVGGDDGNGDDGNGDDGNDGDLDTNKCMRRISYRGGRMRRTPVRPMTFGRPRTT